MGGTPEATIVPDGSRTTSMHAAFANVSFMHSTELWEVFLRARTQPGTVVTAAALAVGEKVGASGRELLTAMVAGYEISIRAALAVDIDAGSQRSRPRIPSDPTPRTARAGSTCSARPSVYVARPLRPRGSSGSIERPPLTR